MPHAFAWAQRQQFASARQRLKAFGWRGVELGPVEFLLNAMKDFFADLAPGAQAMQCRAMLYKAPIRTPPGAQLIACPPKHQARPADPAR